MTRCLLHQECPHLTRQVGTPLVMFQPINLDYKADYASPGILMTGANRHFKARWVSVNLKQHFLCEIITHKTRIFFQPFLILISVKLKRPIINKVVVDNARDRDKFPYFNKFTPCNYSVNCNDFADDPSNFLQGENVPDRNRSFYNLEHQESKCTNKGQKLKTKRESAKSSNETVNTEFDSFHFRVPNWFFGSSNTAKKHVNLEHYVEDYTHFAQLSELPVNPEHQTAEGNSQIKMFSSNLSRKDFREDNQGQTPLNLKCIDNCSHCPIQSSNWRTLPMESDLQKYLSLQERKKGRCMDIF